MPLDDLVSVIETLKQRIRDHGDSLRQNEIRTRVALIDPLLTALGWDVTDPGLVTAEYDVSGRRADYALLAEGQVLVFLEAKRLDENLSGHRSQVAGYASELGIRYPALTNGDDWEVYDNSKLIPIEQRRILRVSIVQDSSAATALNFLLLWRPNLASGRPVTANAPIDMGPGGEPTPDNGTGPSYSNPPEGEGWKCLTDLPETPKGTPPSAIRFNTSEERPCKYWWQVLSEVAEWLVRNGQLTAAQCPVRVSGVGAKRNIVNTASTHSDGSPFRHPHQLSNSSYNSFYMEKPGLNAVRNAKTLLQHCGVDVGAVWVKLTSL